MRFAPPLPGHYTFRSECSDASDAGLHAQTGELTAEAYVGDHPLYKHGPVCVSADQHHFANDMNTCCLIRQNRLFFEISSIQIRWELRPCQNNNVIYPNEGIR